MLISRTNRIVWTAILLHSTALAQRNCSQGLRVAGTITDPTGAVISGADVQIDAAKATTDASGHYVVPCVPTTSVTVTAKATGFAQAVAHAHAQAGSTARVDLQLAVAEVHTDVQVGDEPTAINADRELGAMILNTHDVRQLADDPDDFLRELQMLASVAGGNPASATIRVDGFQNGSTLPPKSSIASIRVSPDFFSAEYQWPPFNGGQIDITTKPGADRFHGAFSITDSDGSFNATDPFSITATPASKRRYGFELSGPILPKKSGFSLALEKRDINEFNVVNALSLDARDQPVPIQQTISAPQRLWSASARGDWQVTPNEVATLSFGANVNSIANQGSGGLSLAESGYGSTTSEYDLRMTNVQTLSANALHTTRVGYTWKRTEQTPISSAPAVTLYSNPGICPDWLFCCT
jgi:Carboxypeptidase regulatory-like domain